MKVVLIGSVASVATLNNHPNVTKSYVLEKNYFNLYRTIKSFDEFDFFFSFRGSIRSTFIKFCIKEYLDGKNISIITEDLSRLKNLISFFEIELKKMK